MLRDLYLFIEVTRCHCVFKELRVSEPSMWEKSRCIYLKFFKVHRTVLKIGKKAKNGEYVELKKTLVVGIFQQLYIEKALSICFQEKERKKRKISKPQTQAPAIYSVRHIHTPTHQNTKVRKEMKPS